MRGRAYAVFAGAICHSFFVAAVAAMSYMVFWGMTRAIFPIGGIIGRLMNIGLLVQFPFVHSYFLTRNGSRFLKRLYPSPYGEYLVTTSFATVAAVQLLTVFLFWTPEQNMHWTPHGILMFGWTLLHIGSWIFLFKALWDAGPALQSGFLGWGAVVSGRAPQYRGFSEQGLFQYCRQPIYLGFFLILASAPTWSFDHGMILAIWGSYCVLGAREKEKRFTRIFGESFKQYCGRVPFFIPRLDFRAKQEQAR